MKRLALILAAVLLLTGCSQPKTQTETNKKSVPSAIHIAYMPNASVEHDTEGAVTVYAVSEDVDRIDMMEHGLVLTDAFGQFVLVSQETASVISSKDVEQTVLCVNQKNVITYVSDLRTVIVYDAAFNEKAKYTLEEGVTGTPVAESEEVYYCVGDHIRALNLDSGLSRNVMQYVPGEQFLTGCFLNGEMIGWNDSGTVTYLSSKDGQVIFKDDRLLDFYTGADNYCGLYMDGNVQQCIYGTLDSAPMQIMGLEDRTLFPQLESNCLIAVNTEELGLRISRYDLNNGTCVADLTVKLSGQLLDVAASESYTWILTNEDLYRWEHTKNAIEDPVSCMIPLINSDNPDAAALEECVTRANQIGEKYGVDIHVWESALLNDESYVIVGEYQTETINQMLDNVETQLSKIPEQILKSTDEYCSIQICLVRSIEGHKFIQYRSEQGLCIAVTPEANMEEALLTGLGWGIDSCIIGNSRDLDYWDDLNPAGFDYDYSYFVNEHRTDLDYLEGENRAFVDKKSMSFPSEDRARIFYYAMTEGNEEIFKSSVLQKKLKTLCEGIREAYGWQKEAQEFHWEQYLENSLAYKK